MDFFFQPLSVISLSQFFIKRLQSLVGNRIIDLLLHFPNYFIQRTEICSISEIRTAGEYIVTLKIIEHEAPINKKTPYKIFCSDKTGVITLQFFHYSLGYLKLNFPIGRVIKVAGKVEMFGKNYCINHPDRIAKPDEPLDGLLYEPVYPLTAGITNQMITRIISDQITKMPDIENWFPDLPSFKESITSVHKSPEFSWMKDRISMDELLSTKLAIQDLREQNRLHNGKVIDCSYDISKFLMSLGFSLTNDQISTINDIKADLESEFPMSRLVQGDVGSGKTIVAIISAIYAVKNGMQVAILAPTEILARQHYATISRLLPNCVCDLLISKSKKSKASSYTGLSSGITQIIIGTHALIQEDVKFKNLGLAVIDEQHKFGVEQRSALINKGNGVNILYLSATPIPRTLMLTINGDMDLSLIREKPANRKPIVTSLVSMDRTHEVVSKLRFNQTNKVYWVCPLIEESEKTDLNSAKDRYESLKDVFGESVLLMHGKMKEQEKLDTINRFREPGFKILVSTTVIEVGVDVSDANVMVIEHSERFGLAQLHQLRGRVGRGDLESFCILLYSNRVTNVGKQRLLAIKNSYDGFEIAEKDLEIRGSGDLIGKQQTGIPEFKVADPMNIKLLRKLETERTEITKEIKDFYFKVFGKIVTK